MSYTTAFAAAWPTLIGSLTNSLFGHVGRVFHWHCSTFALVQYSGRVFTHLAHRVPGRNLGLFRSLTPELKLCVSCCVQVDGLEDFLRLCAMKGGGNKHPPSCEKASSQNRSPRVPARATTASKLTPEFLSLPKFSAVFDTILPSVFAYMPHVSTLAVVRSGLYPHR